MLLLKTTGFRFRSNQTVLTNTRIKKSDETNKEFTHLKQYNTT